MKRRHLITLLASTVAAVRLSAAQTFGPSPVPPRLRYVVNPAYLNAPYEETFLFHPEALKRLILRPLDTKYISPQLPQRFATYEDAIKGRPIPPYHAVIDQ